MSNVLVDKDKLDVLANAISNKSGEALTLTLDEMVDAVDGISTGGGGITPTGNIDITSAGVTDVTNYATATVPSADVALADDINYTTRAGQRVWNHDVWLQLEESGWLSSAPSSLEYTYNAIATGTSVTPTESSQTIGGTNYMMEGAVTVNAIPSNYVGSGVTQRTSSDLSASGATVTAPSGYYASSATKTIASGSATASATKGTVSNHSITVTPSVTRTAGYITAGSANGTAVTVSASELVSGSETKTANGTYDVTNLAELVVNVSGSGTSKNTQVVQGTTRTNASSMTAVGAELTVSKTGTYDIYWSGFRSNTSSSYTWATQLYIDNTAYGSENTTWSNNIQNIHLTSVSLTANQKLRVRGRNTRGTSYYIYAPTLVIVEN